MYEFEYRKASSLDEAAKAIAAAEDGKIMAGGMTLIPTLKQRLASPSDVIDLGGIADLKGVKREGDNIVVGAMTTHAAVAGSGEVKSAIPALAKLVGGIGDPQVRNRGTIGGSIANNDPAADYPAALVALGATVKTTKREIAAEDFFTAMFDTALEEDEIIVQVSFPIPEKAGYEKFENPASRYPLVGSFVARTSGGVRVAVIGAGPCVFRVPAYENALSSNFAADAIPEGAVSADDLNSDIHASADYRAHLVTVMTRRAVQAAG
ncbi:FAD binding domain-containing protein [Minwuia thermotolerans]|uniref:Carbon monoxide dehydrogenase n=1 Tax=Minwuia thermotolerans TaxID=2056226 RepID=A0A2M9G2E1_9PROT|nr:xanthine dehydrogenase family protein subunit M [Minwuia thermotolerans]PJK29860.1 carbon monoxide dehydrogenase [Minwuia thermotolerans]